jgi:hypothetical protein
MKIWISTHDFDTVISNNQIFYALLPEFLSYLNRRLILISTSSKESLSILQLEGLHIYIRRAVHYSHITAGLIHMVQIPTFLNGGNKRSFY